MKHLLLAVLIASACSFSYAQDSKPALLLDGLSAGSEYSVSKGELSLINLPDCNITSYAITLPNNKQIGGRTVPFSSATLETLTELPSGSTFTITVNVGCENSERQQISAEFVTL